MGWNRDNKTVRYLKGIRQIQEINWSTSLVYDSPFSLLSCVQQFPAPWDLWSFLAHVMESASQNFKNIRYLRQSATKETKTVNAVSFWKVVFLSYLITGSHSSCQKLLRRTVLQIVLRGIGKSFQSAITSHSASCAVWGYWSAARLPYGMEPEQHGGDTFSTFS